MSNFWEMFLIGEEETDDLSNERQERLQDELAYRQSQGYLIYTKQRKEQYLFHYEIGEICIDGPLFGHKS